jgi:hypothetical protein
MPSILIVEKLGSIKSLAIKSTNENELFKKAGFKSPEGFKCHTVWNLELNRKKYSIHLYAKTNGRANQENKYEFPPPVDSVLYFGNCLLINKTESNEIIDLTKNEWESIYENLYGGFEDICEEDEEEEEEEEELGLKRTKNGYVKDGFVVDDNEIEDEDYDEDEDEDDDDDDDDDDDNVVKKKSKAKPVKKKAVKKVVKKVFEEPVGNTEEELYLDCTSELCEESYIE